MGAIVPPSRHMLLQLFTRKTLSAALGGLLFLSLWCNALAGVFCPHMAGQRACDGEGAHHHQEVSEPRQQMLHAQMDDRQMSDMDMSDMSMNMPGMQNDAPANSPAAVDFSVIPHETLPVACHDGVQAISITERSEPCSHCLAHSRAGENFPLNKAIHTNPADQIVDTDTPPVSVNSFSSAIAVPELHDHGPPGWTSGTYILISALRI